MSGSPILANESPRPTNVRYGVLGFAVSMSVLLYLDRFAFSVAQPRIREELGLDDAQVGFAASVFFYTYALVQVPSGWFSDRLGGRLTLAIYVGAWSIAIAGLGFSTGLISLVVFRGLLGIGQAGAYPCIVGVLKNWIPIHNRGFANSVTSMGGRLGNLITNFMTPRLMTLAGLWAGWSTGQWRIVFGVYAVLGLAWSLAFYWWFRNRPAEHPACNAAEVREILPLATSCAPARVSSEMPPFLAMAQCPTIYFMSLISIWVNVGWIFLAAWLPTYLTNVHKLKLETVGMLAVIPGLASMLGGVLGGVSTDRLVRKLGLVWGRRTTGIVATGGAALAYFLGLQSGNLAVQVISFAAAGFMIDFGLGSLWAVYQDIAGRHVSAVLGFGNMCGNLAAGVFTWGIGVLAKREDWESVFWISIGALLITMTCWLFVNPARPLLRDEVEPVN